MSEAVQQTLPITNIGTAPLWTACLEEMPDGGWLLELESAQLYLTVKLQTLSVLREAVAFLHSASTLRNRPKFETTKDEFLLGHFGQAPVSLLRDDEDFVRCFLLIGPEGSCSLRVSLDATAIHALADAIADATATNE